LSSLKITPIDYLKLDDFNSKDKFDYARRKLEYQWQLKLSTSFPWGLNSYPTLGSKEKDTTIYFNSKLRPKPPAMGRN
jgi:hypothetical protein